MPEVIVVEECQHVTPRVLDAPIACRGDPAVGLLHEPDPRVVRHGALNRGGRFVRGPVVHHDDLEIGARLRAESRERRADPRGALERGNDHAHPRSSHYCAGLGVMRTLKRRCGALWAQLLIWAGPSSTTLHSNPVASSSAKIDATRFVTSSPMHASRNAPNGAY